MDRISFAAEYLYNEAGEWARENVIDKVGITLARKLFEHGEVLAVKPTIHEENYFGGATKIVATIDLIEPYTQDMSGVSMFSHFCKHCGAPVSGLLCKICKRSGRV